MTVVITSTSTPEEIQSALEQLEQNYFEKEGKQFDAFAYCGVIKLKEDPLTIQTGQKPFAYSEVDIEELEERRTEFISGGSNGLSPEESFSVIRGSKK